MPSHLKIKDLSLTLDAAALTAVRGGSDDQANSTSQTNAQAMQALASVGSGSLVAGPATVQSDNTFAQKAHNTGFASNVGVVGIGGLFPFALG